jgi:hypothetical protein
MCRTVLDVDIAEPPTPLITSRPFRPLFDGEIRDFQRDDRQTPSRIKIENSSKNEQLCYSVISQRRGPSVVRPKWRRYANPSPPCSSLDHQNSRRHRVSSYMNQHHPKRKSWLGTFDKTSLIFEAARSLEGNKLPSLYTETAHIQQRTTTPSSRLHQYQIDVNSSPRVHVLSTVTSFQPTKS